MKRLLVVLAVVSGLLFAGVAASADEHLPQHPHMLLIHPVIDFSGPQPVLLDVRQCVDLAANQRLSLNAHHAHLHTGAAGQALFTKASHMVLPGDPLTPFEDCEDLLATFGLD